MAALHQSTRIVNSNTRRHWVNSPKLFAYFVLLFHFEFGHTFVVFLMPESYIYENVACIISDCFSAMLQLLWNIWNIQAIWSLYFAWINLLNKLLELILRNISSSTISLGTVCKWGNIVCMNSIPQPFPEAKIPHNKSIRNMLFPYIFYPWKIYAVWVQKIIIHFFVIWSNHYVTLTLVMLFFCHC